jgi:hypothetical protein
VPPTVVSLSPARDALQVPVGSAIRATFSERMAPSTFTAATFTLSGTGSVPGSVGLAGDVATFTPSSPLAYGTTYTATISGSVTDQAGNPLGSDQTWSFTTAALGALWLPAQGMSWQWQLSTTPTVFLPVDMYDLDLFDTDASMVTALHAQGTHVVCYLSAGTYEPGRPDSGQFPASVLGNAVSGWPGEKWLDVRSAALKPIMSARLDLCSSKGFDAVEPDNVDGYTNSSGFPLTAAEQLAYNSWLAEQAHLRGLSVALKNDLDQVQALVSTFDWALDEQCFQYNECNLLAPFIAAGKAVFTVEYSQTPATFCYTAQSGACALKFSSMQKHLALDAWRDPCVCP